jgi:hypothetical protein
LNHVRTETVNRMFVELARQWKNDNTSNILREDVTSSC